MANGRQELEAMQIDAELGEAFYGEFDKETEAERALLAAVVRRAILDIIDCRQKGGVAHLFRQQAWSWIMDEHYPDKVMSYEWICHALGQDPKVLRKCLFAKLPKRSRFFRQCIQVRA